jgi:HPt (histidine-containing phosphotransfer) domain-containing protein
MNLQTAPCGMADRNNSAERFWASVTGFADSRPVVFDRETALARLGGMEELLREVMTLMTTECVRIHAAMHEALSRRNAVELKRAAHTLRGSVLLVGAADLGRRLQQVEDFASVNNLKRAAEELPKINRQFEELQQRLAFELNSL